MPLSCVSQPPTTQRLRHDSGPTKAKAMTVHPIILVIDNYFLNITPLTPLLLPHLSLEYLQEDSEVIVLFILLHYTEQGVGPLKVQLIHTLSPKLQCPPPISPPPPPLKANLPHHATLLPYLSLEYLQEDGNMIVLFILLQYAEQGVGPLKAQLLVKVLLLHEGCQEYIHRVRAGFGFLYRHKKQGMGLMTDTSFTLAANWCIHLSHEHICCFMAKRSILHNLVDINDSSNSHLEISCSFLFKFQQKQQEKKN